MSSITIISSFIIQANVITIINYDRHLFIVQATGGSMGLGYILQLLLGEKSQNGKESTVNRALGGSTYPG